MKTYLYFVLLILAGAFGAAGVHAACYSVYDQNDKLIYSSTQSPVSLATASLSDAVQQRFPGGHMTITNDTCSYLDLTTKEGRERTRISREVEKGRYVSQIASRGATPATAQSSDCGKLNLDMAPQGGGIGDVFNAMTTKLPAAASRVADYNACMEAKRIAAGIPSSKKKSEEGKYVGVSGQRYKYDLSNPVDRINYQNDIAAQQSDKLKAPITPGVRTDQYLNQRGAGIQ